MKPAEPSDPLGWVGEFEKELNLPAGFYVHLLTKEDDWSFIIKVHALVEAAVSHLLATKCTDKLLDVFARMGMRNKLAFAKALGVLDPDELTFIDKLSAIRNDFAHDVRNAGATLATLVAGLDANQLKSLKDAIGPGVDPFPIADQQVSELELVRANPKVCIWLRASFLISFAYQRKDLVLRERKLADENEKLLETLRELERLRREVGAKLGSSNFTTTDS